MGMGYVAMKRGNRIITVKQKDLRVLEELGGLELVFPPPPQTRTTATGFQ